MGLQPERQPSDRALNKHIVKKATKIQEKTMGRSDEIGVSFGMNQKQQPHLWNEPKRDRGRVISENNNNNNVVYFTNLPKDQEFSVEKLVGPAALKSANYDAKFPPAIKSVQRMDGGDPFGASCMVTFQNEKLASDVIEVFDGRSILCKKINVFRPRNQQYSDANKEIMSDVLFDEQNRECVETLDEVFATRTRARGRKESSRPSTPSRSERTASPFVAEYVTASHDLFAKLEEPAPFSEFSQRRAARQKELEAELYEAEQEAKQATQDLLEFERQQEYDRAQDDLDNELLDLDQELYDADKEESPTSEEDLLKFDHQKHRDELNEILKDFQEKVVLDELDLKTGLQNPVLPAKLEELYEAEQEAEQATQDFLDFERQRVGAREYARAQDDLLDVEQQLYDAKLEGEELKKEELSTAYPYRSYPKVFEEEKSEEKTVYAKKAEHEGGGAILYVSNMPAGMFDDAESIKRFLAGPCKLSPFYQKGTEPVVEITMLPAPTRAFPTFAEGPDAYMFRKEPPIQAQAACLVQFASAELAFSALEAYHGVELRGLKMHVTYPEEKHKTMVARMKAQASEESDWCWFCR